MELEFELNYGQGFALKPPPKNWKATIMHLLYIAQQPNATLQGTDYEWDGINAKEMGLYWDGGLSGSTPGIGEGPGLRIYGCAGSTRIKFLEGYVDLGNIKTLRSCDSIKAPTKETGRVDWMADIAAVITPAFLRSLPVNSPGRIIPATDFKLTPYCISEIPNYTQASLVAVSIFLTIREAREIVKEIGQIIQELTGAAATATATAGLSIGLVVAAIAKCLIYVIYLSALIIALVNMIKTLITNIIQAKKRKACMLARVMFTRLCQRLNMTFSSSILNNPSSPWYNDTWMPRKTVMPANLNPLNMFKRPADEGVGFPNKPDVYGYFDGNYRDFIKEYCNKYNAEIAIIGNVMYFEEAHAYNNVSQMQIPATGPVGNAFNNPEPYGTNYSELPANLLVIYQVDDSERNTTHDYTGTSWSVTVSQNSVVNIRNVASGKAVAVRLNCALARRKEYLTKIENLMNQLINGLFGFVNVFVNVLNSMITVINWVIGIFGGNNTAVPAIPSLPTNVVNNRIGWMLLSNDSFMIPKTFIGIQSGLDWKIAPTSMTYLKAQALGQYFHGKNLGTRGNQQKIYPNKEFPFCCEDFVKILNRNVATSPLGLPAKFKELKWYFSDEMAREVEYRVFSNFTNNLQETIVIDGN